MSYSPGLVPREANSIPAYLSSEVNKIRIAIDLLTKGDLQVHEAAPDDLWTGRTVIADGTSWNPGSGRGVYWYDEGDSSWHFLG